MSFQAMAWASRQKTGDSLAKLLLLTLANYADERGRAWPSQARLMDDTEMSERSIRNKIEALAELGLVDVESVKHKGGTRNIYTLRVDEPPARLAGGNGHHRHEVPEVPARGAADPINEPATKNSLPGSRLRKLPDDWSPSDEQLAFAREHLNERAEDETAKFIDYHRSKGSAYVDWDAAFRNWIRRGVGLATTGRRFGRPDVAAENRRRLDEYHSDRHPSGEGRPTWD